MPDIDFKTFSAIFLDGELGGTNLEGLNLEKAITPLKNYITSLSPDLSLLLKELDFLCKCSQDMLQNATLEHITTNIITRLQEKSDVFFPGGWSGKPGHAMIYRLIAKNDKIYFLAYNTGAGNQYHQTNILANGKQGHYAALSYELPVPQTAEDYSNFSLWIIKLLQPQVLLPNTGQYDAKNIYEHLIPYIYYLGGKPINAENAPVTIPTTIGQRSGTCTQKSLQQMLKCFCKDNIAYRELFLNYRVYLLEDSLNNLLINKPENVPFYLKAIANTARMLGKTPKIITASDKQLLQKLQNLEKRAQNYLVPPLLLIKPYDVDGPIKIAKKNDDFNTIEPMVAKKIAEHSIFSSPISYFIADKNNFLTSVNNVMVLANDFDFLNAVEQLCCLFCAKDQVLDLGENNLGEYLKKLENLIARFNKCKKVIDNGRTLIVYLGLFLLVQKIAARRDALLFKDQSISWQNCMVNDYNEFRTFKDYILGLLEQIGNKKTMISFDTNLNNLLHDISTYFASLPKHEPLKIEKFYEQLLRISDPTKAKEYQDELTKAKIPDTLRQSVEKENITAIFSYYCLQKNHITITQQEQIEKLSLCCLQPFFNQGINIPTRLQYQYAYSFHSLLSVLNKATINRGLLDLSLSLPLDKQLTNSQRRILNMEMVVDHAIPHSNQIKILNLQARKQKDKDIIISNEILEHEGHARTLSILTKNGPMAALCYYCANQSILEHQDFQLHLFSMLTNPYNLNLIYHDHTCWPNFLANLTTLIFQGWQQDNISICTQKNLFLFKLGLFISFSALKQALGEKHEKINKLIVNITDALNAIEPKEIAPALIGEVYRLQYYLLANRYLDGEHVEPQKLLFAKAKYKQNVLLFTKTLTIEEEHLQALDFRTTYLLKNKLTDAEIAAILMQYLNEAYPSEYTYTKNSDNLYYFKNSNQQEIIIDLLTINISCEQQAMAPIPTILTIRPAYKKIFGEQLLNATINITYQQIQYAILHKGEDYIINSGTNDPNNITSIYKKYNNSWYELAQVNDYSDNLFASQSALSQSPEYLNQAEYYAWVSETEILIFNGQHQHIYPSPLKVLEKFSEMDYKYRHEISSAQ